MAFLKVNNNAPKPLIADSVVVDNPAAQPPAKPTGLNALLAARAQNKSATPLPSPIAAALEKKAIVQANSPVPALAPLKEQYVLVADASSVLPEETLLQFAAKMQGLLDHMNTPSLPQALQNCKKFCDEHKELRQILRASDVQLFVRAARQSYGMTIIAKETNKTKRASTTAKNTAVAKDVLDMLGNIDLGV